MRMHSIYHNLLTLGTILISGHVLFGSSPVTLNQVAITDGASIQSALDAQPGGLIYVPPGEYEINEPIVIQHDNSGLFGPGCIVQSNPDVPIVVVSRADGAQLRDLTLTRPPGKSGKTSGLVANSCANLVIDNLQVIDNCAPASAINIDRCVNGRLSDSSVLNYSAVSVDDRTKSSNYGFAFNCIDGTGIQITGCRGMQVQNNRVVEQKNLPTPELKEKYDLGRFTKKNAQRGRLASEESWESETFPQWMQGSAIHIGEPEATAHIQLTGNYIENAAQGIDIHADHVIVGQNIVNNAAVGVKAMHGSRNILIIGNQFHKCNCHAVLLQPGAASHAAGRPMHADRSPAESPPNIDGGTIVANNVVSDFGFGNAHWMWGNERNAICLELGQTPDNPPLKEVIVEGNIVYDPGRDEAMENGRPVVVPPRYKYAVFVSTDSGELKGPVSLQFSNNILHPGTGGISNVELKP